jgi:hypothetical protein
MIQVLIDCLRAFFKPAEGCVAHRTQQTTNLSCLMIVVYGQALFLRRATTNLAYPALRVKHLPVVVKSDSELGRQVLPFRPFSRYLFVRGIPGPHPLAVLFWIPPVRDSGIALGAKS